jgi:hypothetical protein
VDHRGGLDEVTRENSLYLPQLTPATRGPVTYHSNSESGPPAKFCT